MPNFILRFLVAFIFIPVGLNAQQIKSNVKGIVIDNNDLPVPGATVMLLSATDSLLAQFSSTNETGLFTLKNIPQGDYLVNVTFLGMHPIYKRIKSGEQQDIDLGTIKMIESTTMLSEVQVKADYIPIEINKDSIIYNADAFQTNPDAVVEDLLKKLPGIEVGQDGSIKAQGENVEKVLVDGKEFFGDDPKAATKNLPARAIKKVKVFDKKSDIAEFTGVDDGIREKTIDLQLKEEFKKGLFGKAEAGYGSDDRYMAKANLSRFSKTVQLSFLGQYNNINQQGFSFNERSSFGGAVAGPGGEYFITSGDVPWGDGSTGSGLINTAAGGLNFNWTKNKNFNLRTSYFYNNVESTLSQFSTRQNLNEIPFDSQEDLDRTNSNLSHRFSLNSEIKPDSLHEININGRVYFGRSSALSQNYLVNYVPNVQVESESNTFNDKQSDNIALNGNVSYVRRFGDNGKNIAVTLSANKNDTENDNSLEAITKYWTIALTEALDQLQYAASNNFYWSAYSAFTQPLMKRKFVEFSYMYSQTDSEYDKDVLDIEGNIEIPNLLLSNSYTSIYKIHRPGITFRYSGETQNVNMGLLYQLSELSGLEDHNPDVISKKYKNFLPRVIYRYDIGNGKNIRVSYTTRINPPTITQLSPAIDNSDPLRIYIGNPDLNAEYSHYGNINYHSFTQFTSTSFFMSINGGLTEDRIITSRTVDEQAREVTTPLNIEKEWTAGLYSSFGRPFKPIHSRFNVNANLNLTKTQNVINSELLDVDKWSKSVGISFNNLNSQVLEYNVGGQWTFTDSYYKLTDSLNQKTVMHNYFADVSLTILKKWKISGNYSYNLYTSPGLPNQALPLMKASISRYILDKDKGQIIFSVFDALDENRGLSRNVQVNYIEEVLANSIGRYFMLSFAYNIRGAGAETRPGGMRRGH